MLNQNSVKIYKQTENIFQRDLSLLGGKNFEFFVTQVVENIVQYEQQLV